MKKAVIIGGMAAGCKTAARLKRLKPDYKVTIIEKKPFVSYGTCGMPFYASGDVENFLDLAATPWGSVRDSDFFKKVKDIDVFTQTEVKKIDHKAKKVFCINLITKKEFEFDYDYLVIATGAKPIKPQFPYPISDMILDFHNPLNAKRFREMAQKGEVETAVIIGGGYIGVELSEAMSSLWGIETHIIELSDRLLNKSLDAEVSILLVKTLLNEGIKIYLNEGVDKIELDEHQFPVVLLQNGTQIKCDLVFTCIGIEPYTKLAESIGIKTGLNNGIKVDEQMRTNIPDIWAAGDCVIIRDLITNDEAYFPLGSLANRQGKVAAESIAELNPKFKGAIGTNSVKVFGFTVASSGLSEDSAKKKNIDIACVWGCWYDRPDYMPEARTIFGKLIYEKKSNKILGLQLAGKGEVTRYIDVFSALATKNSILFDLLNFEHAYTPTHSNPMNPLNFLGSLALAQENDGVYCLNPLDLKKYTGQIIDVREDSEIKFAKCPGNVIETSLSEYRNILSKFDESEPLLFVCQKGPRAYEAARYYQKQGFKDVKYLGGGLQFAKLLLDGKE